MRESCEQARRIDPAISERGNGLCATDRTTARPTRQDTTPPGRGGASPDQGVTAVPRSAAAAFAVAFAVAGHGHGDRAGAGAGGYG